MFRTNVNEMNVQPIDIGHELRQGIYFCLDLAPVVLCRPIARQRLHRRELYSLGCICHRFSFRPPRGVDPPAELNQLSFRNNINAKWANSGLVTACLLRNCIHGVTPFPKEWENSAGLRQPSPRHAMGSQQTSACLYYTMVYWC